MILIIIGSILLLFGIFVFFKKNEGETEISILGVKIKSNNSAILLITLGAVIAALGANNSMSTTGVAGISKTNDSIKTQPPVVTTTGGNGIQTVKAKDEFFNQDLLIGTWRLSQTLSGEKAMITMFGSRGAVPEGIEDVMVVAENRVTFTRSGNVDFDGDLLCQFKDAYSNSVDMKMRVAYTGKWEIDGDQLRQTIENGSVTPTNEVSRNLLAEHPVRISDFGYMPGVTETYPIIHLNESSITIRDKKAGENITWTKASR